MPWRETCSMEERVRFILACRDAEESFAAVCESFGISRKTGYKWLDRYDEHGLGALADQCTVRATTEPAGLEGHARDFSPSPVRRRRTPLAPGLPRATARSVASATFRR